jgi:hypothetical protein
LKNNIILDRSKARSVLYITSEIKEDTTIKLNKRIGSLKGEKEKEEIGVDV